MDQQEFQLDCFIRDATVSAIKSSTASAKLYKEFIKYCSAIDQEPLITARQFYLRIKQVFFAKKLHGVTVYCCHIRPDLYEKQA